MTPDACPGHRDLVLAAFSSNPSDDVLERYAKMVPECPDCRRALGIRLGVHPGRLQVPPPPQSSLAGMVALREALDPHHPVVGRFRGPLYGGLGGLTAAAVAYLAWSSLPTRVEPSASAVRTPDATPSEVPVVALAARPAPEPVPSTPPAPRPLRAPSATAPKVKLDAVAAVEDWPAPDFVDLRAGTSKGLVESGVHHVELILDSTALGPGGQVTLTVVASSATELSVCVEGPERGVVWRGAVDAGRTPLASQGQTLAYVFPVEGRYWFSLTTDADSCADAVHVVRVEVR